MPRSAGVAPKSQTQPIPLKIILGLAKQMLEHDSQSVQTLAGYVFRLCKQAEIKAKRSERMADALMRIYNGKEPVAKSIAKEALFMASDEGKRVRDVERAGGAR